MTPYYETLVADKVVELDQSVLDLMRSKNVDEIKKIDEKWVFLFFFSFNFLFLIGCWLFKIEWNFIKDFVFLVLIVDCKYKILGFRGQLLGFGSHCWGLFNTQFDENIMWNFKPKVSWLNLCLMMF